MLVATILNVNVPGNPAITDDEFDFLSQKWEFSEDTEIVGEFIAGARGRYPLAVAPISVKKGRYTIRLQKGLLDREAVVIEVDESAGTLTLYRAQG